jgi:hypothetical protein
MVRFLVGARDISLVQSFHIISGAHRKSLEQETLHGENVGRGFKKLGDSEFCHHEARTQLCWGVKINSTHDTDEVIF